MNITLVIVFLLAFFASGAFTGLNWYYFLFLAVLAVIFGPGIFVIVKKINA